MGKRSGHDTLKHIDQYFHDCEMLLPEMEHDEAARELRLPIVAPDSQLTQIKRLFFPVVRSTVVFKKWLLVIRNVVTMEFDWDDPCGEITNVELGEISVRSQNEIVIKGHWAVTIRLAVSAISADFEMTNEIVGSKTGTGISFRTRT